MEWSRIQGHREELTFELTFLCQGCTFTHTTGAKLGYRGGRWALGVSFLQRFLVGAGFACGPCSGLLPRSVDWTGQEPVLAPVGTEQLLAPEFVMHRVLGMQPGWARLSVPSG